jgi:glucose/arabinose dehydrogenase
MLIHANSMRTRDLLVGLPVTWAACAPLHDQRADAAAAVTADRAPPLSPPASAHPVIRFADLPPPYATPSVTNPPIVVPRPAKAQLRLPPGFRIAAFADDGFQRPRRLALAPNGDVFVSDSDAGAIAVLRGVSAAGQAAQRFVFATGLTQPFGIAFAPGFVYVGDTNAVVRFRYEPGDVEARAPPEVVAALPGTGYHEHWTRNLLFGEHFTKLYVSVGSTSNDEPEENPERAAVLEMNADGTARRIFASGTRNPIGMAWRPGTSELWAVVQERDGLGDDLVPDYLARVVEGGFYGWPFAYLGPHEDPRRRGERPDLVAKTREPDVLLPAHFALMDLVFCDGPMFPADWRGDVVLSAHGSWNRSKRVGYELLRVRMREGKPQGGYEDFVTGWALAPDLEEVWGRPVGLVILPDGSLLIADDGALAIWRVTFVRQ